MTIVYTNRRTGEERVHVELDAAELTRIATGDPTTTQELHTLLAAAARRFPTSWSL
ncbi:hypothetical protein [Streptomyces parvus]|uniref:hypothetical protein n=1 Tax=Streptomyces parvus TaxID=66428 RepID=UPI0021011B84|nr:hypothetical protein [Streptomyces parvus]MCQ1575437.1 hypothetical protein [Streptomyces parvus]